MQRLKFSINYIIAVLAALGIVVIVSACSTKVSTTVAVTQTTTSQPFTTAPVVTQSQTPQPTTSASVPTTTAPITSIPAPTTTPPLTTTVPAPTTSSPPGPAVTLDIAAQSMAFDKSTLTVKAGSSVTLVFNNQDTGIPHNVSIYQNLSGGQTKVIYTGSVINAPGTVSYTFTAPAAENTYFFQCDIHPSMNGTFVVTP